jgi:hypothetical protein
MKKYLIWIGAAVLVMALASPSAAQFKTWGHLEFMSYWEQNRSLNRDLNDANYQGISMRYRFNLGYGDPKTVMAVLGFEANSRALGEGPADAGVQVLASAYAPGGSAGGSGPGVAGNTANVGQASKTGVGDWGTDAIGLQVRHAYLDFTIPNTPLTMQVGLQNVAIGGFLGKFFFFKDVPAFILNANFAPHTLSALWLKGYKQNFYMDNDLDYYGLLYRLKQQMFNVEAWFFYGNDRRSVIDTWNLQATPRAGSPAVGGTSYSNASYTYSIVETSSLRGYEQKPWWLGANVPITVGNWKFEPTFVYVGGKYYDAVTGTVPAITSTADISAYLGDLVVSYRLGPGLKFLVEGFYTSGRDGTKNVNKGDTQNQFMWPGVSTSSGLAGTENKSVFGVGSSVFFYSNSEFNPIGPTVRQLDPSGTAFLRANTEYNPFTWMNLNLNYLYIMNTANQYNSHIAGVQTPFNPGSGSGITALAGGTDVNKSYIGSEINAIAKIAIYKDFQYMFGFGYFFPGDAFDTQKGRTSDGAFIGTADQAWVLLTNLKYAF